MFPSISGKKKEKMAHFIQGTLDYFFPKGPVESVNESQNLSI